MLEDWREGVCEETLVRRGHGHGLVVEVMMIVQQLNKCVGDEQWLIGFYFCIYVCSLVIGGKLILSLTESLPHGMSSMVLGKFQEGRSFFSICFCVGHEIEMF